MTKRGMVSRSIWITASIFALQLAGAARAQDLAASDPDAANATAATDIIVTASRLGRRDVPTPLLEIDAKTLFEGGRTNAVAALQDFPQLRSSASPITNAANSNQGGYGIDLRGLGQNSFPNVSRTLSLIDGRRSVAADNGDLAVLPSIMIKRADIVTGSASASWGSDAVAGVVNLILIDDFAGVRLGGQAGISERGDGGEAKLEGLFGSSFGGGRGHIVIGADYTRNNGIFPRSSRKNVGRWSAVASPAPGGAAQILVSDVGTFNVSPGGLITSGVNAGKTFNADGTLRAFDFGRVVGSLAIGGEASNIDDTVALSSPFKRYNFDAHIKYQLAGSFRLSANILYSHIADKYDYYPDFSRGDITISADNVFLPAAIRSQMTAAGESSFTMGRTNTDFAVLQADFERELVEASVALDGKIGDRMSWSAYVTHGALSRREDTSDQIVLANFLQATDAVTGPGGQPICRIALVNPGTNCVPINLFGFGAPSKGARDYVLGTSNLLWKYGLDAGGLTLRGEPFDTWAGPASIAIGAEARHQTQGVTNGPLDRALAFGLVNQPAYHGRNTTKEAFGEVLIPVLREVPLARRLQLNAAARISHDRSGSIWSWKLGLINEVTEGLQFRATRSRDIRAPTISELDSSISQGFITTFSDPELGTSYPMFYTIGGNPDLKIERSNTTTIGITATPKFAPSLRISFDYFDIDIKNAIDTASPQSLLDSCFGGNSGACAVITRGSGNRVTNIASGLVNFRGYRVSGVDGSIHYRLPVSSLGSLIVRSDFTWMDKFRTNDGLTSVDLIGSTAFATGNGVPRLRANSSITYSQSDFDSYLRARYVSRSFYNKNLSIENNRIDAYTVLDLGGSITIGDADRTMRIFFNVNNVLDRAPPIASQRGVYYDLMGRYFQAGASVKF